MKILCLHGRGSNNEIFRAQTAGFRAELEDFEFLFVQGTVRHTEGNWSLYTAQYSNLPLYTYYNALDPTSILQTHEELRSIIATAGPFDGVIGYSGGAALAAEMLADHSFADPLGTTDPPFRFAVFINGASPLRCFRLDDPNIDMLQQTIDVGPLTAEAEAMFLRPSALRKKEGVSEQDTIDHAALLAQLKGFTGHLLSDGTPFLSDGTYGLCRWGTASQPTDEDEPVPPVIDILTLHVRSTDEDLTDPHHGLHLLGLCDPARARQFHHVYGHDFPRGRIEIKEIARLIRDVAEESASI